MIKKVKKGFTLIELVVVIAVIAILSAVSVVAYVGITNSAKKSGAEQKAAQIVNIIRAGALANDKGYVEQERTTHPYSEGQYRVKLEGHELKFFIVGETDTEVVDTTFAKQKAILNDMLDELEEMGQELQLDKYEVVDEHSVVYVQIGSDNTKFGSASF